MNLNVIHLKHRKDRLKQLKIEMAEQNIQKYKIWAGILDKENPRQGIAKSHKQIVKWLAIKI